MSENCCSSGNIMLLACSGGSNVGQLSNHAAVELTQEGFGKMFCLAGIGGHLSGFVQSAKDTEHIVAIDGCEIGCAKAIMDHHEISPKTYVVLTEAAGIAKNKNFQLDPEEVNKAKAAVRQAAAAHQK